MEIGEPAVLAKLPRAGLSGDGQTSFCQVYGIRDGRRKKRHEICAAVDGNSISIFEVRIVMNNSGFFLTRLPDCEWQKYRILASSPRLEIRQ